MAALTLNIVTPRRTVFSGEIESVTAPGTLGSFQVLTRHAPLLSSLTIGELKFSEVSGLTHHYAVSGGFLEVKDNVVTVLAETAESASDIDRARAEKAQARAAERLANADKSIDRDRANSALERAKNRLKISSN